MRTKWVVERGRGKGGRKEPTQREGVRERGRVRGEEKGYGRKDGTREKGRGQE